MTLNNFKKILDLHKKKKNRRDKVRYGPIEWMATIWPIKEQCGVSEV
jgi:hypothetical protein